MTDVYAAARPVALAPTSESSVVSLFRRVLDVTVALMVLILVAPLLVAFAIAIRVESPGPALFRQTRIGKDGEPFTFVKLRGMYVDARERWPELYAYEYTSGQLASLRFHPVRDPRVTAVGRLIRRTSIDELPNLWNVVRGEMALVGPRPEIPELIPYYRRAASIILSVKPGVTSVAKVTGRDGHTFTETLALDVEYVETRSLRGDLKILWWTLWTCVLQRGVRAG